MVRTYKDDEYNLLSPWEKSMRSADALSVGSGSGGHGGKEADIFAGILTFLILL